MKLAMITGLVGMFFGTLIPPFWNSERAEGDSHLEASRIAWEMNEELPIMRWKTLVGGTNDDAIARDDVQFGLFQLAPGATYPGHAHPAPEVYYVLEGEAEWTVGSDTFGAKPGTTIYAPPGTTHRMVNPHDEVLTAVWAWWAPDGDTSVFEHGYRFTEPRPEQPAKATFPRTR